MKKTIAVAAIAVGLAFVPACSQEDVKNYSEQAVNQGRGAAEQLSNMSNSQIENAVKDIINKSGKFVSDEVKCNKKFDIELGGHIECASSYVGEWTPVQVSFTKTAANQLKFDVKIDGESIVPQ